MRQNTPTFRRKELLIFLFLLIFPLTILFLLLSHRFAFVKKEPDSTTVLIPPPPGAPESDVQRFNTQIRHMASPSAVLYLNPGCLNAPYVMKVKQNTLFTIQSTDTASHTIVFDPDHSYKIGSKSAITVQADFPRTGVIGYTCDGLLGDRGYVVVEK